jgi:hypothetical protein
MSSSIAVRLEKKATRIEAIIELCQNQLHEYIPGLVSVLSTLSWDEVEQIIPYLPLLGPTAVEPLCSLLSSSRKQTIEAVTSTLAAIGDVRAATPLVQMMEEQAGQAYAIRARDALIRLGKFSVAALINATLSKKWETRYYAVQALGVIGAPLSIGILEGLSNEDRSDKVRQAAKDGYDLISFVSVTERYKSYPSGSNQLFVHTNIFPTCQVDAINMNQKAHVWTYEISDPEALDIGRLIHFAGLAILTTAHTFKELWKKWNVVPDAIFWIGPPSGDSQDLEHFSIAILSDYKVDDLWLSVFLDSALDTMSALLEVSFFKREESDDHWLANTNLVPKYHIHHNHVFEYHWGNDLVDPKPSQALTQFGVEDFYLTPAHIHMDYSHVYRENLAVLQEQGKFLHIPTAT